MPKLAETYFHLRIKASPRELFVIQKYLETRSNIISRERFKKSVSLEVRVEQGSVKVWIIAGSLMWTVIASYGSFRSGIDYTVKDSRSFSQWIINDFKSNANIKDAEIIRIERRLGVPGKIQRLLNSLDKLKYSHFREDKIEKKLSQFKKDLVAIFKSLDSREDYRYLQDNLLKEISVIFDKFKSDAIEYNQIKIKIIDLIGNIPFEEESEYPVISIQQLGIIREEDYSENISKRFLKLLPPKSN